jgi:short-subunit dehydrogenase
MGCALATGASGGIGAELCRLLAADGHDLVLVARSEERLASFADELERDHKVRAVPLACDLTQEDAAVILHQATADAGIDVDILVNNAGFGYHGAFLDSNWERQRQLIQVNIVALTQLSYLFGADMLARGHGRILNVASTAAFGAGPYMGSYYASKAWVLSLSQALSAELRGTGVTVTAICPGPTATSFEKTADLGGSRMFTLFGVQSARSVAKRGYLAMLAGRPVVYHSPITHLFNIGSRVAPRTFVTRVVEWVNGKPAK